MTTEKEAQQAQDEYETARDAIKGAAEKAIKAIGEHLEGGDYTMSESDLEALQECIEGEISAYLDVDLETLESQADALWGDVEQQAQDELRSDYYASVI